MNRPKKNVFVNSMIVLAVVLLMFSFMKGKDLEDESQKATRQQAQKEQESFTFSSQATTSIKDVPKSNPSLEELAEWEHKLSDFYSKKDIELSRKVANTFIHLYYEFDGNEPLSNIESSKAYMTASLYTRLKNDVPRPILDTFKKKAVNIELYEPYNISNRHITWIARVNGETFNPEGKLTGQEMVEYELRFKKEANEEFKVKYVAITMRK